MKNLLPLRLHCHLPNPSPSPSNLRSHPSSRAYEVLRHYFEAVLLPEQQLLVDPNTLAAILAMIPDEGE